MKTEHSGPKRGKGAWCRKAEAKAVSKSLPRTEDARLAREAAEFDRRMTETEAGARRTAHRFAL